MVSEVQEVAERTVAASERSYSASAEAEGSRIVVAEAAAAGLLGLVVVVVVAGVELARYWLVRFAQRL